MVNLAPHINIVSDGMNIDTSSKTPIIYEGSTYVPLRVVSEALGYNVGWNNDTKTVSIDTPVESSPIVKNKNVTVTGISANPRVNTENKSGNYYFEITYHVDKEMEVAPALTVEVLNQNKKVVSSSSVNLSKLKGSSSKMVYTSHFALPFKTDSQGESIEKMAELYSYRVKVQ